MTRRDYELLSSALAAARRDAHTLPQNLAVKEGVDLAARRIADALAARSAAFSSIRFLDATGTKPMASCSPCGCAECVNARGGER